MTLRPFSLPLCGSAMGNGLPEWVGPESKGPSGRRQVPVPTADGYRVMLLVLSDDCDDGGDGAAARSSSWY